MHVTKNTIHVQGAPLLYVSYLFNSGAFATWLQTWIQPRMTSLEPLGDVGATHKLKCVHKKSRLARNLLINKDSKFFVLYLSNFVKATISRVLYVARILAWLKQNCGFSINIHVFGESTFFMDTLYLEQTLDILTPTLPAHSILLDFWGDQFHIVI